jgi:outer membrane protein assembly factor BamB
MNKRMGTVIGLVGIVCLGIACAPTSAEDEGSSESALETSCQAGGKCSMAPLAPDSPWPKFRRDMRQTGRSPIKPAGSTGALWTVKTGKGIFSSAVIGGDGTVYIGSADRYFYAIDKTGQVKWKVLCGEIIDSSALLDDKGRVYFGAGDGIVRALDAKTGQALWQFHADEPEAHDAYIKWFESNVAIGPDGTLYAPNDNKAVYALRRDDGTQKWKWLMNDQTWSLPAVDPQSGTLYIGNNYIAPYQILGNIWRNVFAIDKDGREVWGQSVQATISASPAITGDKVVMGAFDGYVRAHDKATGDVKWQFATKDHLYASASVMSSGTLVQPSSDGTVYALDPNTGAQRWAFDTREPIRSSAAIDGDDNVYFGGGDGRLYVLNKNGTLRWSMQLATEDRNDLNASPALGRDAIIVAGESGEIFSVPYDYCLRPEADADTRCDRGGKETLPQEGTFLYFTTPLGSILPTPPKSIDENQALAFSLFRREQGDTALALLDEGSLVVETSPRSDVDLRLSADRRFLTLTPKSAFAASAGKMHLTLRGKYLKNPAREGLRLTGGTAAGTFRQDYDFDVYQGGPSLPLAMPQAPGAPSSSFELYRIAVPLPTVMPSYNQIGFDSLHYLVGMVQGDGNKGVGWVIGGTLNDQDQSVVDPATKVMFPVEVRHHAGLITIENTDGFVANAMNFDMPFDSFRWAGRMGPDGSMQGTPSLHVKTQCANIPTYGPFMSALGLCNPETDLLNVFGGSNVRPFAGGVTTMPQGMGTVSFENAGGWGFGTITNPTVTVRFQGSQLKASEHAFGVLVVDAATGKPMSHKYGLATEKRANADGSIASVTMNFPQSKAPASAKVYLMVDTYPAAMKALSL